MSCPALPATTAAADVKLAELLERIDEFIARRTTLAAPRPAFEPTWPLGVADIYVLGMDFQRRRNSSFIDGVGDDARGIAGRLAQLLAGRRVA